MFRPRYIATWGAIPNSLNMTLGLLESARTLLVTHDAALHSVPALKFGSAHGHQPV